MSETTSGRSRAWSWLAWAGLAALAVGAAGITLLSRWAAETARPAAVGQERSLGGIDPHLHVRLESAAVLAAGLDGGSVRPGYRLWRLRLSARNDAAEISVDPSRFSIHVRDEVGGRWGPRRSVVPGSGVASRFSGPLRRGETASLEVEIELPDRLAQPRLVLARDSWLVERFPVFEGTWLQERATWQLPGEGRP